MAAYEILRGKVTAYPEGKDKGLVEVSLGAYHKERDTVYARVEQSLSGVYWLPEIGDIVEVHTPDLPGYEARIIHIHRKEDDPQTAECWTQKNDRKQLQTRSGHTVTLDDTQDRTAVTVHTAGGLELRLEDKPQTVTIRAAEKEEPVLWLDMKHDQVKIAAGKKLTISCAGASITFDSSGNLSLRAKGKLALSGQEISLDAQTKLTAKGQQVEAAGSMSAKITGQSQLQLSSSGVTQVQGGLIKLN